VTPNDLKEIRAKLKLSQRELAGRAGIRRNTVTRHEMGDLEIRPFFAVLYRLLEHLGESAIPIIEAEIGRAPRGVRVGARRRSRRRRRPQ
jgi:transcriptional regulator with XRE-family HTH domain